MSGPGHSGHLPFEILDRLVLAALSPTEKAGAEAHMEACDRCRTALQTLQADCAHFEREVLPRTMGKVRQRLAEPAGFDLSWFKRLFPAAGLAAAAAVALVVVPRAIHHPQDDYDIGIKGGPIVQVYDLHGGSVRMLGTGSRVATGDRLQFAVESSGYEYLLIAAVDGTGNASAFFPAGGTVSAAVPKGRSESPESIELDAAPGPERLFGYFSHTPIRLDAVSGALRADPTHPPHIEGAALPVVIRLEKDGAQGSR